MKSLITLLVVLCTALFVTLDAAPVLPHGYEAEFEAVGRQQSDEMAKTFLNVFSNILTAVSDKIGRDGSIQADNALGRTVLNLASNLLSSMSKNADPNDELQQSVFNGFNSILSSIGKRLGDGGEIQSDDEMMQTFMNVFSTILSAMTKKIDNGEIQSVDEIAPAFLNLMGNMLSIASKNVDPNDKVAQTFFNGFSTLLSAFGRKFNGDGGSQIQSNNELAGTFLNLLGNLGSALQKKANPKDDVAQTFMSLFNTMVSGAKNRIGGGQEKVHADTLDEHAAMVEADMDLTDEAKAQFWGTVIRTFGPILLKKVLDG